MYSLRILSKGKISDLTHGFKLKENAPFSVFLKAKKPTMETSEIISCRLIGDLTDGEFPIPVGDWTPGAIAEISPNAIDMDKYEVFWGTGEVNL